MITSDKEAWLKYPFHRKWFNKLWVSELFNYNCGPNCVPVSVAGEYVVRPIYNLHGMGAGAKFVHLDTNDEDTVPPGYFWCEKFFGEHLSVELRWDNNKWNVISVFMGSRNDNSELYRFNCWKRVNREVELPRELNELWDCGNINVEMIGGKIIEVHLRGTPDPTNYDELIPIWSDTPIDLILRLSNSHHFVFDYERIHGTDIYRNGFFCR